MKPGQAKAAGSGPEVPARAITSAIFWDFDGTIYRSPAAYRRYAEEIASGLPPGSRAPYLERVEGYLRGEGGIDAADAWQAATKAAGPGLGAARRQQAFRKVREYLESDACPVEVPAGLPEALSRLRRTSRQILLTNTPAYGVFRLLVRLGVAALFDEVICEAGKPGSLPARLEAARAVFSLPAGALASVGDNFPNDIAPALSAGAVGAYIDPFGVGPTKGATLRAPVLEALLPAIEAWAATMGAPARP